MILDVSIRHRQGNLTLEAGFRAVGRLTALFGPPGSGNTPLLKHI